MDASWPLLEKSLRRLLRFRELGAPVAVIEKEIALAKRFWTELPRVAPAGRLVWPEDLVSLARELGFEPDRREAVADPQIEASISHASDLYRLAAAIDRELSALPGASEIRVVASGSAVWLTGNVSDAETLEQARAIALRLAGGKQLREELQLRSARAPNGQR